MQTFDAKTRFMENKAVAAKHRERMADPDFRIAAEAALQHHSDLSTRNAGSDPQACAAAFHRIAGAREFVGVLLNIADVTVAPKPVEKQSINYRA